jgi:spore coat polysaccharide biosynthesis protein SpsF
VAVAVIQARMGSTRLPGKVLRPLGASTVLAWVVRAARASGEVTRVVVATTTGAGDDAVAEAAAALGCDVHRGAEDDVLTRFLGAVAGEPDDAVVVRLTADCPLLDPAVIATLVRAFRGSGLDYLSTAHQGSLPHGLDVEVTSAGALRSIDGLAEGHERVHVMPRFYRHPEVHAVAGLTFAPDASDLRVTLDTAEDAALIEALVDVLGDAPPAWRDVIAALRARPDLVALNADVRQKALEDG